MNKPMLSLLVLLSAASTAAFAQQQDMTLQQERDQMGADLEDNRQQIGRDINRIRESDASQNQTQGINRGGVQSDAVNPQPNVPGTANPPAGTGLPSTQDNMQQPSGGAGTAPAPGATQTPGTPGGANGNASPGGAPRRVDWEQMTVTVPPDPAVAVRRPVARLAVRPGNLDRCWRFPDQQPSRRSSVALSG